MRNWMETRVPRRLLAMALSAVMVLSLLPAPSFAAENGGLCEHHTEHTEECGYVAAVEGQDCAHVCGDDCYSLTTACTHVHGAECYSDGVLPDEGEEKAADACTHQCTEETGCVTRNHTCVHTAHDEACGYVEAVAGQPCGFVCQECAGEPAPVAGDKIVTSWQWIDEEELLDEETGGLALPGASEEMPAYFADVVTFLPWEITATVDGVEETLSVDWVCDDYPESGAYEGEYIFTALLPQGYVLAEGVSALTVNVLLGGGETYATVSQIPYLTFDIWKEELVSAQCSSATLVTSEDTKWTSGWYVARGDVAINSRVEINGDVNLILEDGCSLTVNDGIRVFGSNALYIYAQSEGSSMGRLTAESVTNGLSGIGGNQAEEVGTIYIDGGNITATGKEGGAGIGAGGSSKGTGSTGGFIRICGGIVNATGGLHAAGIGGGPDGKGGQIYIFGGTVIAHNGDRAACIGDGTVYWDNGGCKIFIIGDATVIADATKRGTGIGTYNKQISDTFTCSTSSTGVAPVIITSGNGANNTSPPENGYSISDTGKGYDWKGLIFEGTNGTIYRMDSFTLRKDLTVRSISGGRTLDVGAGKTLTIASGTTLTIPSGVTLAVNGTLTVNGNLVIENGGSLTLNGNMTVANGGSLTLNGTLTNTGSLVFQTGASVSGTGTYTGSDASPSLQGAVVLEGKYLHIHKLVNDRCACGYSEYIFVTVSGIKAANKVYDGTVNATLDYSGVSLRGAKAGDKVSVTATGTFGNKNAGANKTVTITNLTLTGADAGKYRLETTGQQTTATASITQKPVTAAVTVESKAYDGKNTAKVSVKVNSGLISGDSITITGLTGTFENANAGTNKTVTVNAANKSITGTGSGNYTVTIPTTAKGTITKAQAVITVEAGKNTYSKTYGDSPFQLTGITENSDDAEDVSYAVTEGTDVVSVSASGEVTILKAGTATITLSLPESANYLAAQSKTIRIDVARKAGTVNITGNPGKTYDGQPAVLTADGYTVTGDGAVTVEYKVKGAADTTYSSNAPTNAGEYTVRVTQAVGTNFTKAENTRDFTIARKEVTITGVTVNPSKTYDRKTGAEITQSGTLSANYDGENLSFRVGTASYEDKNVGTGKKVFFSGFALTGSAADNYTLVSQPASTKADITAKEVTITGAAVQATRVYNGTDAAVITAFGTLKDSIPGDDVRIDTANAAAAYDTKNVGEGKTVAFSGFALAGGDKDNYALTQPASTTAAITAKPVTLTVTVKDKSFDDTTTAEIDTVTPMGFVEKDDVQVVNGIPSFTKKTPGGNIPVTFTPFSLTGNDAGNYRLTQPTGVTGKITPTKNYLPVPDGSDLAGQNEVWVDGVAYPIQTDDGHYVNLPKDGDLLTTFTYQGGTSTLSHENYPTGMAVYRIDRQDSGATVEKIDALDNLLQYSGCSIRITGKRGVRMITSLTKDNKKTLTKDNLAGYTLEEYGTVVQWADTLGSNSLTLDTGKSNYAYKKGVADPVFANKDGLTQYTNVLVWKSLTNEQLGQDIVMRPYIILKDADDGNLVTLYGGAVSRSIGYIAYQNRAVFKPGTAAYKYVWDIIHAVYGTQYDSDYKG